MAEHNGEAARQDPAPGPKRLNMQKICLLRIPMRRVPWRRNSKPRIFQSKSMSMRVNWRRATMR
jgi:hypothetical protein